MNTPRLVFSSNGQGIALAGQDPTFEKTMNAADIIHADGMSVVLASRLLTSLPLPERVSTTDFFPEAAKRAERHGLRFYFLGGTEELNRRVVETIKTMFPSLIIAGRHHGYFSDAEDDNVCEDILRSRADVVWVGLGKPKQEQWCVKNRSRLAGVSWLKTCGGLYAHINGDIKRAPAKMQLLGLEWLYRLLKEPFRLGPRYLLTNPYAIYCMLRRSGGVTQPTQDNTRN